MTEEVPAKPAKPKPAAKRTAAAKPKPKPAAKPKPKPKPEAEAGAEAEAKPEAKPRSRATDAEVAAREAEALDLLISGKGTASTARIMAERHGVTMRQARNYVRMASLDYFEAIGDMSPQEIEFRALHNSHCLERIAETATEEKDYPTAIRAQSALATVLLRLRAMSQVASHPEANGGKPRGRIRLGDSRGSGLPPITDVIW
jgi:hypothetical protein